MAEIAGATFAALSVVATINHFVRGGNKRHSKNAKDATDEQSALLGLHVHPSSPQCDVDIVFVHGLTGNAKSTWTTSGDQEVFWPVDFLIKKNLGLNNNPLPGVRILTYGYDTNITGSGYLTQRTLYHHANYLLRGLMDVRQECLDRPIIFVAHSLGGIVVKSALIFSREAVVTSRHQEESIINSTAGIFFFGTPQNFSSNLDPTVSKRLLGGAEFQVRPKDALLLDRQLDRFKAVGESIPQVFFYETQKSASEKCLIVPFENAEPKEKVVSQDTELRRSIPLAHDHVGMTKFASPDGSDYQLFREELHRLCTRAIGVQRRRRRSKDLSQHTFPARVQSIAPGEFPFDIPPQNLDFFGRSETLDNLDKQLRGDSSTIRRLALIGEPDVGKTQLALQYAYTHQQHYSAIFWLDATNIITIESSFWEIGKQLLEYYTDKSPDADSRGTAKMLGLESLLDNEQIPDPAYIHSHEAVVSVIRSVLEWLDDEEIKDWLLIYDNVESFSAYDLAQFIPLTSSVSGYVILTSRNQNLSSSMADLSSSEDSLLPVHTTAPEPYSFKLKRSGSWLTPVLKKGQDISFDKLQISGFSQEESINLLKGGATGRKSDKREKDAIKEIAENINGSPRELIQSRLYMDANHCTAEEYSRMLQPTPKITLEEVLNEEQCIWLDTFCMLSRKDIPRLLLSSANRMDSSNIEIGLPMCLVSPLFQTGCFTESSDENLFSVHYLIRKARRQMLKQSQEEVAYASRACQLLVFTARQYLKDVDCADDWVEGHFIEQTAFGEEFYDRSEELAKFRSPWNDLATICEQHGRIREASCFYKAASLRAMMDKTNNKSSIDVRLAYVYQKEDRIDEAEALCTAAKVEAEKNKDTKLLNDAMRVLVLIKTKEEKWPEAVRESRTLITSLEIELGPSHPKTMAAISQLATIQATLGQLGEAELLLERLLMVWDRHTGSPSSKTIGYLEALALMNRKEGELEQAEQLYKQILKIKENRLGFKHIETLKTVSNLALVLDYMGRFENSWELHERVLSGLQEQLGESHPEYMKARKDAALSQQRRGNDDKAVEMLEDTIRNMKKNAARYPSGNIVRTESLLEGVKRGKRDRGNNLASKGVITEETN